MLKKIKEHYFLILIFILVFAFRLYFVFQSNNFSSDEAYFHLRHVNSILSEGKILFYDELSYGGRFVLYPPLFHMLLAYLTFGNLLLLKILPALFASLMVFVAYAIAKYITNDTKTALFTSILASFVPLFIIETLNNLSPYSLVMLILFLLFYFLTRIKEINYLWYFILFILLLAFLHAAAFLFLLTILIYLIILNSENIPLEKIKKEVILLSVFIILLIGFIIYKKAFLQYGFGILWQNIPVNIFADEFKNLNVLDILFGVGLLPLIFGLIGLYYGFKTKRRLVYMISSLILVIFMLLLFRLMPLTVGLMFLGVSLAIISSLAIKNIFDYFEQTKLFNYKRYFIYLFLLLVFVFGIIPTYNISTKVNTIFDQTIDDMQWINKNLALNATVLAPVSEGNLVSAIAKRKNVADSEFLLAPNPFERYEDIKVIYTVGSEAIALNLIKKYDINYIYVSDNLDKIYENHNLNFLDDKNCFKEIKWRIYEVRC